MADSTDAKPTAASADPNLAAALADLNLTAVAANTEPVVKEKPTVTCAAIITNNGVESNCSNRATKFCPGCLLVSVCSLGC
jgi:hypothetical protein